MYEGDQWLNGTTVTTPWISSWVISEIRIAPHLVCCTTWASCRQSLFPATSYSVWPDNVLQLGLKSKRWKALHKSWLYLGPAAHLYHHSLRFITFLMSLCCCSDTEASCLSRLLQSKPSAVVLWHSCTEVKDSMAWLLLTYIPSYSAMWALSCWHFFISFIASLIFSECKYHVHIYSMDPPLEPALLCAFSMMMLKCFWGLWEKGQTENLESLVNVNRVWKLIFIDAYSATNGRDGQVNCPTSWGHSSSFAPAQQQASTTGSQGQAALQAQAQR